MRSWGSARVRWYLLALAWAALLVLGIGGFLQQAGDAGEDRSLLDTLYLTLQLVTLDYGGGEDTLNWRLQITRFVAPVMAAGTVLQAASVVFADQFRRFRLRFARGHTVVCGLGDAGARLAVELAGGGARVAAVEADPAAAGVAAARAAGVGVLVGDATDAALLRAARVERAARVIVLAGSDATNVAIAAAVAELCAGRTGTALRCSVHLADVELTTLLRAADLAGSGGVRVDYFTLHERAARALLGRTPPFGAHDDRALPAVFGLGQLGRSLVVQLAQQWADVHPAQPLRLLIVDRAARGRWEALRLQHPALAVACTPVLLDLDLDEPAPAAVDELVGLIRDDPPTWVAVGFEDESLALSSALFVRQALRDESVAVVVRVRTEAGLGGILASAAGVGGRAGLVPFAVLDHTCTGAALDGGLREQLARAVHQDYLVHAGSGAGAGTGLRRPWEELDDDQRDLSRRRVDGLLGDLDALGCDLAPLRRWGMPDATFTPAEVEAIAAREHRRWFDDRIAAGWRHGPLRDDAAKLNPLLVAWEELSAQARAGNVAAASGIVAMLARAGFEPVRRATAGSAPVEVPGGERG